MGSYMNAKDRRNACCQHAPEALLEVEVEREADETTEMVSRVGKSPSPRVSPCPCPLGEMVAELLLWPSEVSMELVNVRCCPAPAMGGSANVLGIVM